MTVLSGATSCASRFTRWTSVPTAQIAAGSALPDLFQDVLGGPAVVGRLHDVPRHLGVHDHADARMLLADQLDLLHGEALWTEQWPFHSSSLAASASSAASPPSNSFGSHTAIRSSGTPIL